MSMEGMGGVRMSPEIIKNPEVIRFEEPLFGIAEFLAVQTGVAPDSIYDTLRSTRGQLLAENPNSTPQDFIDFIKLQFGERVANILEVLYNNPFEHNHQSSGWILKDLHELGNLNQDYEQIRSEFFGICCGLRALNDPLQTLFQTGHLTTYIDIDATLKLNSDTRPLYISNELMIEAMDTVTDEIKIIVKNIQSKTNLNPNDQLEIIDAGFNTSLGFLNFNITDIYNSLNTLEAQISAVFDKIDILNTPDRLTDFRILDDLNLAVCGSPDAQKPAGTAFFAQTSMTPFSISSLVK